MKLVIDDYHKDWANEDYAKDTNYYFKVLFFNNYSLFYVTQQYV